MMLTDEAKFWAAAQVLAALIGKSPSQSWHSAKGRHDLVDRTVQILSELEERLGPGQVSPPLGQIS
jgi:hypothetical protein